MTPLPHPSAKPAMWPVWLGGLLVLITIAAYWPVQRHEFINYDDPDYVTNNPRVQAGLNAESIRWAFTQSHSSNWHPLTWMSHMLDCQLFGLKPAGHHLMNVGLHAANVLLVFLLLRRLTGTLWRSALVAALFALHPLHVESVAWVAERKDVLSTFFGLLTLLAYAAYAAKSEGQGPKPKVAYALALPCFAFGLMSKPMLVTLPCVFLLLDYWPLKRVPTWRLVLEKIPFLLLALAACVVTMLVQRGSGATVPLEVLPASARLAQMPVAYLRYLGKTFWPEDLAVFYPYVIISLDSAIAIGAGILILGLTGWSLAQIRRRPYLATGWFWFLGTLVPVIGLVQVGRQAIADRYTYLPHIGLFVAIVWLVAEVCEQLKLSRRIQGAAAALVVTACLGLTSRQLACWQNTGTLARQAIAATEDNYTAHAQLAGVLVAEGKWEEASNACREALRIRPDFAEAHNTLANIFLKQDRHEDAITSFQAAIRGDARYPDPHQGLAALYLKLGKFAEAEQASREALRLAPLQLPAIYTLAQALHSQNRFDEAITAYQQLTTLKSGLFSAHYGLGSVFVLKGDTASALREFETARSLQPTNATVHNSIGTLLLERGSVMEASNYFSRAVTLEATNAIANAQLAALLAADRQDARAAGCYRIALQAQPDQVDVLNNFAWLLATSPDDHVRDGASAVRLAERGCELTRRQAPLFLGTLAAAYAEAGRFDDAIATAERARDLAREQKLDALATRNEELLQLYRAHKPYREARP